MSSADAPSWHVGARALCVVCALVVAEVLLVVVPLVLTVVLVLALAATPPA